MHFLVPIRSILIRYVKVILQKNFLEKMGTLGVPEIQDFGSVKIHEKKNINRSNPFQKT